MDDQFEKIEKYVNGDMTGKEKVEFEASLSADLELQQLTRSYETSLEAIRMTANDRLKESLNEYENTLSHKGRQIKTRYWYAAAAALALLVLSASSIFLFDLIPADQKTLAQLYEEHIEIPNSSTITKRGQLAEETVHLYNEAITHYQNRNYGLAIPILGALLEDPDFTRRSAAAFYLGLCHLYTDDTSSAIEYLSKVSEQSSFLQQAVWYTGLAYLKADDRDNAKATFLHISQLQNHYRKKEVTQILEELEK